MFSHMIKLIWKRKARNFMLSLEILLAFVIVFAIVAFGVRNYQLYQMPSGFSSQHVWSVDIGMNKSENNVFDAALFAQFKDALASLPGVQQVAFAGSAPYTNSTMRTDFTLPSGAAIVTDMVEASDEMAAVLDLNIVQGRWFDQTDNGQDATSVVINRRMARALFGTGVAIGKTFDTSEAGTPPSLLRVVGVVDDFRKNGDLMSTVNFTILRAVPGQKNDRLNNILLKLEPGTPRSFETTLNTRLKSVRNDWSFQIEPLAVLRESTLQRDLLPLMILSIIAVFMLVMVAFGLFGVLWQNTTQRIPEIGLRRAIGASGAHIYRQIVGEQLMLSSAAMLVALLLLVQLPLTGALGAGLNWTVFGVSAGLSMMLIYLLSLLCSLYPGWRASRLSPTEALHYE